MSTVDWARFFLLGWGLPFSLYVIAQIAALVIFRGRMRWLVAVPILPMSWVVFITARAWAERSNLWPIIMIFSSPVALVYVLVITAAARQKGRSRNVIPPGEPGEQVRSPHKGDAP